jgi:predicted nucleic acid-binding protein
MVCADSSSLVAFWRGDSGRDVDLVDIAFANRTLYLAPVCLCELLCSPNLTPDIERSLLQLPRLEFSPGYWERAGRLRARLLQQGYRPKVADILVAQSCLDYKVPLITRDRDFQGFTRTAALSVLI